MPLYLRFNAADDEFPAQAALLFHRSAAVYLDLQTLFIAATYLTGRLIAGTGGARSSIVAVRSSPSIPISAR